MTLKNLILARSRAGLSQTDAGALIGKSQSHYGKIERGEIGFSAAEALTLCDRFKLTIQQLLESDK